MIGVEFINNRNPRGRVGFHVHNTSCVSVTLRNFTFRQNEYLFGSVFGKQNDLESVLISDNIQWRQMTIRGEFDAFFNTVLQRNEFLGRANDTDQPYNHFRSLWIRFNESCGCRFEGMAQPTDVSALENAVFRFPEMSTSRLKDIVSMNNTGCVMSIERGTLTVIGNSQFINNTGGIGSVIIAFRSNVSLTDAVFEINAYNNPGGCLDLADGSDSLIHNVHFRRNFAIAGSCILATDPKSLGIWNSTLELNYNDYGGAVSVDKSFDSNSSLTISDCQFLTNNVTGSGHRARGSVVIQRFNGGNITIQSTTFGRQVEERCSLHSDNLFGMFINDDRIGMVVLTDTLNIALAVRNCSFVKGLGILGSGIRLVDVSGNFSIAQSLFHEIRTCTYASAIFLRSASAYGTVPTMLTITDCAVSSNRFRGQTIYISGSRVNAELGGIRFEDNVINTRWWIGGSVLFAGGVDSLSMINCTLQNNSALIDRSTMEEMGSVHIERTRRIRIERSNFNANSVGSRRGNAGGAIYCSADGETSSLEIHECEFERNVAADGGALYLSGFHHLRLTNCTFRENRAADYGGAIRILAPTSGYDDIIRVNFTGNKAAVGGALCISGQQTPSLQESFFSENEATLYGGAIALIALHRPGSFAYNGSIIYDGTGARSQTQLPYMTPYGETIGRSSTFIANRASFGGSTD